MIKWNKISRKLKAVAIAFILGLLAKWGLPVDPVVEDFIVYAVTLGVGWLTKESQDFVEERIGNRDLLA